MDCDFRDCNDFIKSIPIINEITQSTQLNFQSSLHEWFKSMSFEDYKKIKTFFADLEVDFFVEFMPVGGGASGETTEEEYRNFQRAVNEGRISKLSDQQVYTLVSKAISPEVMSAYKFCVAKKTEACTHNPPDPVNRPNPAPEPTEGPNYGINYRVKQIGTYINVTIWYVPYNETDSWPIVENFYVSESVKCLSGCLKEKTKLDSEHVIVLERVDPKEATIVIDFDKTSVTIQLERDKVPPIKIQRFRVNYNINEFSGNLLTCTLPNGYKILSGYKATLMETSGRVTGGILLGCFPKTSNEWNIRLNGVSKAPFYISINAIYDPLNEWEIKTFKNSAKNSTSSNCEIEDGYILTGGGIDISLNDDSIRHEIGVHAFYPRDKKTWAVAINGQLTNQEWELSTYAIGLKKKGNLEGQINISNDNQTWDFQVNDRNLIPVGGGFILEDSDPLRDITGITPLDLIPGSENTRGFAFSWNPIRGLAADSVFTKYITSLKHPEMDINVIPEESIINI
ncbi:hypothetical protein QPL78_09755 [Bacillus halotolerans]|uniref:hypothetical protein n=1 Tax=Bacillus halotolerans TaxID=260554 RepID=UPI00253F9D43|nr:hypothetical protein [Bacillus halotolerans]WIG48763.1 hypothetical protein QPL78_09755 [Bacillus halotolerans]